MDGCVAQSRECMFIVTYCEECFQGCELAHVVAVIALLFQGSLIEKRPNWRPTVRNKVVSSKCGVAPLPHPLSVSYGM